MSLQPTYNDKTDFVGHGAFWWQNLWLDDSDPVGLSWLTDLAFADACYELSKMSRNHDVYSRDYDSYTRFMHLWKKLHSSRIHSSMVWHLPEMKSSAIRLLNTFMLSFMRPRIVRWVNLSSRFDNRIQRKWCMQICRVPGGLEMVIRIVQWWRRPGAYSLWRLQYGDGHTNHTRVRTFLHETIVLEDCRRMEAKSEI